MRRLLIGIGAFFFLLATAAFVVPLFLPKDVIKDKVVAIVDQQLGWRLRLDGPVSLSLLPGFSLKAEDVGMAGEAGADGIEFAKAGAIDFGLAWEGLFGGAIQVTRIHLEKPDILLEVGPDGLTSWEPRRAVKKRKPAGSGQGNKPAPSANNKPANTSEAEADPLDPLKRIGVDRFSISGGTLTYSNLRNGDKYELDALNLTVTAPDLAGDVNLEGDFNWQGKPIVLAASLTDPLSFAKGNETPLSLNISTGENEFAVDGKAGITPVRMDLGVSASGPSVGALAEIAGDPLPKDPGAFSLTARLAGDEASVAISDMIAKVGSFDLDGSLDADLAGASPAVSGRLVLNDGSLEDLLTLAGQKFNAKGKLGADIAFSASGVDAPNLLATLDVNGTLRLASGSISGLGLASAVGGDKSANSLKDISLKLDLKGFDAPVALSGAMKWRGEGFTVTGKATPAPLLAGIAAPVSGQVKSKRVTAGFDGHASADGNLEGAVTVETKNLRRLMTWMGQPIEAGRGLKAFKVSGIFSVDGNAIAFDETRFSLDKTSGRANGKIVLGAKPRINAKLDLGKLVLDPYLASGGKKGWAGQKKGAGKNAAPAKKNASAKNNAPAKKAGGGGAKNNGWSTAPIDFSGLKAVNANFTVTANAIHWGKIKIGKSALKTTIKDGVLKSNLQKLRLYKGNATGNVTLDGAAARPSIKAKFALKNLNAFPVLRDAANTKWLEGTADMNLNINASGASQLQLVRNLNGTAKFNFIDGAIRGINIPKMVRGLSVETMLGWQDNKTAKTDFSSLSASFAIKKGVAVTKDLSMIGPLVRVTGGGRTNMPQRTLNWKINPKIVASLKGQAPAPRAKGKGKKMSGLGVPIIAKGPWDNPQIYPDIAGILQNPEAAYKQLQSMGGDLIKTLNQKPEKAVSDIANEAISRATGGKTQIDVQKVIEGDVDDQEVLKAVEEGFGLPSGLLGSFGKKKKKE